MVISIGDPVYSLMTKGGLNIVLLAKAGSARILGLGSHRAIALHTAKMNEPDLSVEELSKSEEIPTAHFQHLVSYYLDLTSSLNEKIDNG